MKDAPPIFLGTIQQRYRPRNGAPARAFADWIKDINSLVCNKLMPVLKNQNMTLRSEKYNVCDEPYNLINIADFNSLIAQSQEHNTPVFLLTKEQIKQTGVIWETMKKSRDDFYGTFEKLAGRIVEMTDN